MDPNKLLELLEQATKEKNAHSAAEAFDNLHTWIVRGGFLPKKWQGRTYAQLESWDQLASFATLHEINMAASDHSDCAEMVIKWSRAFLKEKRLPLQWQPRN